MCVLKATESACLSREIQECRFVPEIRITRRCLLEKWQFADMKYSRCTCIWCRASPQGETLHFPYTGDPRKYSLSTRKERGKFTSQPLHNLIIKKNQGGSNILHPGTHWNVKLNFENPPQTSLFNITNVLLILLLFLSSESSFMSKLTMFFFMLFVFFFLKSLG